MIAPLTQEVGCVVVVGCHCVPLVVLFVDSRWASSGRSKFLEELVGVLVVGVYWPLPSAPASSPMRHTSGSRCHSPSYSGHD